MLSLPRVASAEAHQDAWIAVIAGALAPFLVLILIERLFRQFPGYSFVDISRLLFGKILGTLLVVLVMVYFMLFQALVVSILTEITHVFILPQTPHRVILVVSVLAIIYVATQGGQVVARINEIFLYQFLLFTFLWLIPMLSGDYTNLLPVGGSGLKGISQGILSTAYAFSGMEILLFVYPMVTKPRQVLRAGLTAIGVTLAFYLILTLSCLLVFGSEMLAQISIWPGLSILKVLSIPVIGRSEVFFLLLWMGFSMRPAFTMHMAGSYALTGLWRKGTSRTYLYLVIALGLMLILIAFIPLNTEDIYKLGDYVANMYWIVGLGYPLLYLAAAAWRRKAAALQ